MIGTCENCGAELADLFTTADDVELCQECYDACPSVMPPMSQPDEVETTK